MQTDFSEKQLLNKDNQSTEKIFKKWSPAIFLGWSSLNFDEEMIRKEFFKSIRYPY
ncbi:exodeoxyribonuclease I, partial [Pelagibacterales bacterium SAG-MED21]|nr:exodeoxyribonuclease I [Pelagibacterales bacterium SAG-MED21]